LGKLFGTDGVRGVANRDLTPELAFKLGRAGTATLAKNIKSPTVVIGKDTRISGDMLEAAMAAGICSVGGNAVLVGVVPTPAVAYLTRTFGADAGVMISASHNPVEDNGIKFFFSDGFKLPDQVEASIEAMIAADDINGRPTGGEVGRIFHDQKAHQKYTDYLVSLVQGRFEGIKIVVDTANGSASTIAPAVYSALGADVVTVCSEPDGCNINDFCGSTHPEVIQKAVLEHGADIGFTHDGDADRVLACDHLGQLVDGDQILAICGLEMIKRNQLPHNTIVATVMSNLGLDLAFKKVGGKVIRTNVGDRYVLEEMRKQGLILGGEQSGHVVFLDHNTTGDGIITALKLLTVLRDSGEALHELAKQVIKFPQSLVNIQVTNKEAFKENRKIAEAIAEIEMKLGDHGRILVRPSGTEPKIRIMVECDDPGELKRIMDRMTDLVRSELS